MMLFQDMGKSLFVVEQGTFEKQEGFLQWGYAKYYIDLLIMMEQ